MVILNYRDTRPIYTQIVEGFREQIIAGILQPGDRLPSVRELASQLAINPNTIQRAYRELEAAGWIASVAGKGSFVSGIPGENRDELEEFDNLVARLLSRGISREDLIRRINQGGNDHA
jgi:GntR family transcriptional regulator